MTADPADLVDTVPGVRQALPPVPGPLRARAAVRLSVDRSRPAPEIGRDAADALREADPTAEIVVRIVHVE